MSGGTSGFHNAPVTRAIVVASVFLTVALGIQGRPSTIRISLQDTIRKLRVSKLFSSVFAFSSSSELLFGMYLLYYFRVFERQIGTNKYSVFVVFSTIVSLVLQFLALAFIKDSALEALASGPYGLIFSSFVPFFFDIPVSSHFFVFSIPFSDKSLTYLAGLQLLFSSWKRSLLPGACGVLAGTLYRLNIFGIHRAKLPNLVTSFFSRLFISSSRDSSHTSSRGNNVTNPSYGIQQRQAQFVIPPVSEPHQESIATLVSMGFDINSARQALVRARNDINVATDFLLQAQSH